MEFAGFQSYKVLLSVTIGNINTCDFLSFIQHKGLIFYTFLSVVKINEDWLSSSKILKKWL